MFALRIPRHLLLLRPRRWLALFCAGVVGLLSLAGVSPDVHAALHGNYHGADTSASSGEHADHALAPDHICAVTLFSRGTEGGCPSLAVVAAPLRVGTTLAVPRNQVAVATCADKLPPGRGPPAS